MYVYIYMKYSSKHVCSVCIGVIQSSHNAVEKWSKQVLHVWAASDHVSRILTQAYCSIPKEVKSNTVVLVTVATNANEIFTNKY